MKQYLLIGLIILSLSPMVHAIEVEKPTKPNHLTQWLWGKELNDIPGLKYLDKQSGKQSDFLKVYVNPDDPLELEGVKVKQIRYTFWKERLCAVSIQFEGQKNYRALKEKVSTIINNSGWKKAKKEQAVWFGAKTIAKMTYNKDVHKGRIQLKSNDINRQIQLMKFTPSNVYSAWIRYKRGISRQ